MGVLKSVKTVFKTKNKPAHAASHSRSTDLLKRLSELKKLQFRSIRARGLVVGIGVVLVVIVIAIAACAFSMRAYYMSAMRSSLEAKAETASEFFTGYVSRTYAEYYQSAYQYAENFEDKDSLELQFVNTRGRVEISSTGISAGLIPGSDDIEEALRTKDISFWHGRRASTGEHVMAVSAPLLYSDGSVVGVMRYVTSLKLVTRAVSQAALIATLIGSLVLALVVFSNLYFLKTITGPISSLTAMARRIAEGSYGTRVEKSFDDEIGELTDTINDMSQKLSHAERIQTEFISSVSHELRTPLTAITGWSETMSYDNAIQGDSRKGLEIIRREAGRLTKMVEELLEFTRIQDGRFTLHVDVVDLPALVEDSLYTYNELFRHENMKVAYTPPDEDIPLIPGDPERLAQVFLNILDNACKYGKSGRKIDVVIEMHTETVSVEVRDYGPGIPADELPHVKKKFYKGSSKERGSGIGLAVCDEIMERHNGRLDIANAPGGGTCVTITLPLKN